jgi:CheY-like chemotaxis protein
MVVDDEPFNLEIMSAYLEDDYEVVIFESAQSALDYLENDQPDLILMDNMMPEMNGLEACQIIKQNDALSQIPVIVVSAYASRSDIDEASAFGADDYLTKPFEEEDLFTVIRKYL